MQVSLAGVLLAGAIRWFYNTQLSLVRGWFFQPVKYNPE